MLWLFAGYVTTLHAQQIDSIKRKFTTGALTTINPVELLKYDNAGDVAEIMEGRIPGSLGGANLRGLGGALILIDGFPRPISSVNINEVAQITILKDPGSAILYGVQGNNGVIMITTKRGQMNKKIITGMVEYGFNTVVSYPKYLGATQYMELYNEALANDGLNPLYTSEGINATRNKTNPLKYPDVDYYDASFLKQTKPSTRVVTEFSGGNEHAQYYLNLGWARSGSVLKVGEGQNQHNDRINMRSNLNYKITRIIKSKLDLVGLFDINKGPIGDFFNDAATLHPNYSPPLIDTSLVTDKKLLRTATLTPDGYLLGGTSIYKNNVYGNLHLGGYNNQINTTVLFSNSYDIDLAAVINGLSFKAQLGFDFYNQFREYQNNSYAVYEPSWSFGPNNEDVMNLTRIGVDKFSGTQGINNTNVKRRIAFSGMMDYYRVFGKKHEVSALAGAYFDKFNETDVFQSDKHMHFSGKINYAYDSKYIFDFSAALASSPKLPPANRVGFSPSLNMAWVASNEKFLKNDRVINYLKLKASAGIINTDMKLAKYYSYENIWTYGSSYSWNDGTKVNNATILINSKNDNLFYEKRKELNFGAEATLFNNSLLVDANFFTGRNTDQIIVRANAYPAYMGGFTPSENYGEDKYKGYELGLTWRKNINNDFGFDIGSTLLFLKTTAVKRDELYTYDYLNSVGTSKGAVFGLEALGIFQNVQEIADHAIQSYGPVQPGDIKYKDQNRDGIINDYDNVLLGKTMPDLMAGLNMRLKYKQFTLFAIATGTSGALAFKANNYYQVYGDLKFSEVALKSWTPATAATATYPRLSSKSNNNNFLRSSFWKYNNSRINLSRVQLNYDLSKSLSGKLKMQSIGFYIRASNLATFSRNSDIMELNIGTEPQYRYYSAGLKASF